MAANRFGRGELFRRFHFQNRQKADEIDSAGDDFKSVEWDNQGYQGKGSEVFPATTTLKRKGALSEETKKRYFFGWLCLCLATARLYFEPHPASLGLYV